MQLFELEELVEGRHYVALSCSRKLGLYQAFKPHGKSFLVLRGAHGEELPPDLFDWWTTSTTEIPSLQQRYQKEELKIEEQLKKNRKSR